MNEKAMRGPAAICRAITIASPISASSSTTRVTMPSRSASSASIGVLR